MAGRKKTQEQAKPTDPRSLFFEEVATYAQEWQQEGEEDIGRETFSLALQHAQRAKWLPLAERLKIEPEKTTDAVNWWIHLCARGDPPRPLLGEGCFATEEELLACQPNDPLLAFENTLALIRLYEEAGNYPEALKGFRELKELIEQHREKRHLEVCLREMEAFCWNHQYDNEGIRVCEDLAAHYRERDKKEYAFALMQEATYLGRRDGFMVGLEAFRRLQTELPDHSWVPLNLARYFSDHGCKAEAVEQYRLLIGQRDRVDEEVLACALTEVQTLLEELGRKDEARAIADLARGLLGREK